MYFAAANIIVIKIKNKNISIIMSNILKILKGFKLIS
jgi:hypothetical protein